MMESGNIRKIGNMTIEPWYLEKELDKLNKYTVDCWKNIPAGGQVASGYGGYLTAPAEEGSYTLYELAYASNTHAGWMWEKVN